MTDTHAFPGRRMPAHPPRRMTSAPDLTDEAIRRGVQYLAFRLDSAGLQATYAPGPGQVIGVVAQAARAAVEAHETLARGLGPSNLRSAALIAQQRFTRQLAELKSGATRTPATALRSAYLDALAEVIIEQARLEGVVFGMP